MIWFDLFYLNRGRRRRRGSNGRRCVSRSHNKICLTYQSLIISWWCLYSTLANKVKFADWKSVFFSRELWRRSVQLFQLTIEAFLVMILRKHQKKNFQFCRPISIQYTFDLNRIIKSPKKRNQKICTCRLFLQNFKFGNMISPFICSNSMYVDSCYLT